MIDLAIARAQRTLVTIRLGLYACAVAAVFGLVGTAIRTYLTRPPRMSPVVDLAVLVMVALGLVPVWPSHQDQSREIACAEARPRAWTATAK